MKILITGATGMIGDNLIAEFKRSKNNFKEKYYLRILIHNNKNHNYEFANVELAAGDLLDLNSLYQATLNIDTVVHAAGLTQTNQQNLYYQVNALGTENLLKACQKNKVKKFIYLSSRTASRDGGAYAASKLLAEKRVEQSSLNWIILSLAEVYGAGEKEAISRLISLIKKSYFIPVIGNGQYFLSPVFVDDVVLGIIGAIKRDDIFRKKYILAGPEEFTYKEMINRLLKIFKAKRLKIYFPIFLIKFLTFIFYIFRTDLIVRDQVPRLLRQKPANIDLAKKDLNFNPRSFEIGIREMLQNRNK